MMNNRYFGTDGIRGRVGELPITADFMLRLGNAAGRVLVTSKRKAVVIGKDTRISGYMFESSLEAGLAAAGADIHLLGPMPTPAVAHLTRSLGACAGIVISASHNPYYDNGIKFFSHLGLKLPDDVEQAIESALEEPFRQVDSSELGRADRVEDAPGRYVEFCKSTVPYGTYLKGMRLVVDCANGATYRVGPQVFSELGATVSTICTRPDGLNINVECGSTYPERLAREVVEQGADAGIAFDGDGDRVIMVDGRGNVVDGDQILYILAHARHQLGQLEGGVVGTVMSNFGLEQSFRESGIEFHRAPVGDRFVHNKLTELGWKLGGEASGHILCLDRSVTGDGIVSALQVIEHVFSSGRSLEELAAGMPRYPQVMINVPVAPEARQALDGHAGVQKVRESVEKRLEGKGRVILRPSGTEPLIRVTVEGPDEEQVQSLAEELAESVRTAWPRTPEAEPAH